MTMYPLEPLAQALGLHTSALARQLGLSGSTWQQYRDQGVSSRVADRLAVRAGFHPAEIWPHWLDQSIAADQVDCAAADCAARFVPASHRQKYCTPRCQKRVALQKYRRKPEVREAERAARRAYYQESRRVELAKQAARDRARRAEKRAYNRRHYQANRTAIRARQAQNYQARKVAA